MARLDRYGEPVDDVEQAVHTCHGGWLSSPDDDVARPCLTCRPHLADRATALQRQLASSTR